MMLARLIENTDLVPTYTRPDVWEESSTKKQKQWKLSVLPSLERVAPFSVPPALALNLVNLVPPLSLELFELLPMIWSLERVSL